MSYFPPLDAYMGVADKNCRVGAKSPPLPRVTKVYIIGGILYFVKSFQNLFEFLNAAVTVLQVNPNTFQCLTPVTGFLLGIFSEEQNLLLCKFLLLCYCFRTKFQGGRKVFRGQTASGGRPLPPVEESQVN